MTGTLISGNIMRQARAIRDIERVVRKTYIDQLPKTAFYENISSYLLMMYMDTGFPINYPARSIYRYINTIYFSDWPPKFDALYSIFGNIVMIAPSMLTEWYYRENRDFEPTLIKLAKKYYQIDFEIARLYVNLLIGGKTPLSVSEAIKFNNYLKLMDAPVFRISAKRMLTYVLYFGSKLNFGRPGINSVIKDPQTLRLVGEFIVKSDKHK